MLEDKKEHKKPVIGPQVPSISETMMLLSNARRKTWLRLMRLMGLAVPLPFAVSFSSGSELVFVMNGFAAISADREFSG